MLLRFQNVKIVFCESFKFWVAHLTVIKEKKESDFIAYMYKIRNTGKTDNRAFSTHVTLPQECFESSMPSEHYLYTF